jgi:hypothetical protein
MSPAGHSGSGPNPSNEVAAASLAAAAASLQVEARLRGQPLDDAAALERAHGLYARALALLSRGPEPQGELHGPAAAVQGQQVAPPQPRVSQPPALPQPASYSLSPQPPQVSGQPALLGPRPPQAPPPPPSPTFLGASAGSGSVSGDLQMLLLRDPGSLVGRTIASRYRLTELLSETGVAVLYQAVVERTGQDVSFRVLRGGGHGASKGAQRWARLQQQAREAQRLAHPAFVKPDEVGEASGLVYVVTEHAPGQPLSTLLEEQGPLSVQQSLDVAWRVGEAMRSAHEQGVIHGCLAPDRVLAQGDPQAPGGYRVRVLDAGLFELLSPGLPGAGGSPTGLPWYMSPEQLMGREADERADVYGLGAVLFQCLAGAPPFADSESLGQFMARKTGEEVAAPSALRPGIPPHVDWAVLHALSPEREKRTPSMTAFLQSIAPPKR